jgi:hypothetical protein
MNLVGIRTAERGTTTVYVRFTPSDVPVLTSCPAHRAAAIGAAARTLCALGQSYLGGHLEISWSPSALRHRTPVGSEYLAASRAVVRVLTDRHAS